MRDENIQARPADDVLLAWREPVGDEPKPIDIKRHWPPWVPSAWPERITGGLCALGIMAGFGLILSGACSDLTAIFLTGLAGASAVVLVMLGLDAVFGDE